MHLLKKYKCHHVDISIFTMYIPSITITNTKNIVLRLPERRESFLRRKLFCRRREKKDGTIVLRLLLQIWVGVGLKSLPELHRRDKQIWSGVAPAFQIWWGHDLERRPPHDVAEGFSILSPAWLLPLQPAPRWSKWSRLRGGAARKRLLDSNSMDVSLWVAAAWGRQRFWTEFPGGGQRPFAARRSSTFSLTRWGLVWGSVCFLYSSIWCLCVFFGFVGSPWASGGLEGRSWLFSLTLEIDLGGSGGSSLLVVAMCCRFRPWSERASLGCGDGVLFLRC